MFNGHKLEMMDILTHPIASLGVFLAAFLMIWPGYAVLHLLGLGRHRSAAILFAGPSVTLALAIVLLSGSAWANVPLHRASGPIWTAMVLLGGLGIGLRVSVRRQVQAFDRAAKLWAWRFWAIALLLPWLIMPASLLYGLSDFINSTHSDAWSYAVTAEYLAANSRGSDGGLSASHQYAAHLANSRNASSAIMANLGYGLGVMADQTMTLFCLLALFCNTTALIAFARTLFIASTPSAAFVVLVGLGWPANVVSTGNFDQLLLLPLLPLIAMLAYRAGAGINLCGASAVVGLLSAAALLAYVELAFIGMFVAMAFVFVPGQCLSLSSGRALLLCSGALPIFVILTWPGHDALLFMLVNQYQSTTVSTARPGEGSFAGLIMVGRLPAALWALGGEFPQNRLLRLAWLIGDALNAVALFGIWIERRRWSVIVALGVVAAAFCFFAYGERYSYGAYKIVSVNFWLIGFFAVAGGTRLAEWLQFQTPRDFLAPAAIAIVLFAVTAARVAVQAHITAFKTNALQQRAYREASVIRAIVLHTPTLLSVRDGIANQWAVFYLLDTPLLIAPYRIYMAQPHVIPFMERAAPVDPATIRFIVTDRSDTLRAAISGARRIWDGTAYSLWEVNEPGWTVLAAVDNPNGNEPGGIWLGGAKKTEFLIVAGDNGSAELSGSVERGPRAEAGRSHFQITTEDAAGQRVIEIRPGQINIPITIHAGRNLVGVMVNNPANEQSSVNGDTRPMILRFADFTSTRTTPIPFSP